MIRIQQLKLPLEHDHYTIENKIRHVLGLSADQKFTYEIIKRSVDARKKPQLNYVYTVDVSMSGEGKLVKRLRKTNIRLVQRMRYHFPKPGVMSLDAPPVIVGAGPAGLFCAYELALHGYRPIILERGKRVEDRSDRLLLPPHPQSFGRRLRTPRRGYVYNARPCRRFSGKNRARTGDHKGRSI